MEILISSSSFVPRFPQPNNIFLTYHRPTKKLILISTLRAQNLPHNTKTKTPHKKPLLETLFHSLDLFISTFLDSPLRPAFDPQRVLSGNFSPVDELPPTPCHVIEGSLPPSLNGAYIRNGPNPQFLPRGPHHLFDGDGMLHVITISAGQAIFSSRYIKTYKYVTERRFGYPIFQSLFSSFNNGLVATVARCLLTVARILSGHYNPTAHGFGPANTSLALFPGKKLFALCESDLPYAIKLTPDGDIITLGRRKLTNERLSNMTAHPKIDPRTGEAFAFSYNVMRRPFLTYLRISSDGREQNEVDVTKRAISFMHDFAVTENYAVFPDLQIVIDAMEIIKGRSPVRVDATKMPRLGFIPRYAADESGMFWVDVPGLNMIHVVNAWDEGDKIVIVASNALPIEHALDRMDLVHSSLEVITIDAGTRKLVTRYPVSDKPLDFGVINPRYAGIKNRYVYAAVTDPAPKAAGVVKLDLLHNSVPAGSRMYGAGCYGGEPFFVAREPDNADGGEDDGYLITYVHDEDTGKSRFIVMDAKSINLDIVADVLLPARVPYGFHGIFVNQHHLHNL